MTDLAELVDIDVVVVMDSDGDCSVGKDLDEALSAYENDFGGTRELRSAILRVKMRPPTSVEASVTVPDEAGQQVAATTE